MVLIMADLRKMKKVTIDKEAMTVSAGGGCQAVDVETPLQGTSHLIEMKSLGRVG